MSVGWLVGRSRKRLKCAKRLILTYFFIPITFHASPHSYSFIQSFIYSFIHSFIHSFIYIFIHSSKTFIHKNLIKRGALIGLHLALLYLFSTGYQKSYWLIFIKPKEKETFIGSDHLSRLISNDHRCGHDDDNLKRHE